MPIRNLACIYTSRHEDKESGTEMEKDLNPLLYIFYLLRRFGRHFQGHEVRKETPVLILPYKTHQAPTAQQENSPSKKLLLLVGIYIFKNYTIR